MSLSLVFHGGNCCGIKTVHGFGCNPLGMTGPLPRIPEDESDKIGTTVSSKQRFFHEEAPLETKVDRLKRYIAYMGQYRPSNILEAAIATREPLTIQDQWIPIFEELGFKLVNSHKNSNTGNTVHVWHLNVGEVKKEKKSKKVSKSEEEGGRA